MSVAGRRQLVAQPGGLTLGFAMHVVLDDSESERGNSDEIRCYGIKN